MARLIDANKLKRLILAERDKIPKMLPSAIYEFGIPKPNHHGNSMRGGIRKALRCMEQCERIDAVEVVRCKDCKHWMPGDSFMGDSIDDMQRVGGCPNVRFRRLENDFCSYGERR